MKFLTFISALALAATVSAQTLYVPGGTSTGIGNNTGNSHVGIGTASPGLLHGSVDKLLDVEGADSAGVSIRATNSGGREYLWFTYTDGFFYLYDATAGLIRLSVNSAGNVGIGSSSPNTKLEVTERVSVVEGGRYWSLGAGRADGSGNGYPDTATVSPGSFAIRDVWMQRDRLHIDSLGNVGIGTITPTQKLAVNGTIRAKEVIVDTGWADYVFADDYRLAPLSEVEAHIKAKRHLPDIPSAAEVAEHGVSMGEMQARLLAKVEELTLHVIELKKENDQLRKEMKTLAAHLK